MLLTDWNWNDALQVAREEGRTEIIKQTLQTLMESFPLEKVAELLKMLLNEAQRILQSK